jgi:hypothetical protein
MQPSDINSDGIVDAIDLSILVSRWGSSDASADINSDGVVDALDLSVLVSNWGSPSSQWTPEPTRAELFDQGASENRLLMFGYDGSSRPTGVDYMIPLGFRHGGNTGIERLGLTSADLSTPPTIVAGATISNRIFNGGYTINVSDVTFVGCLFIGGKGGSLLTAGSGHRNVFIDCTIQQLNTGSDPDPSDAYRNQNISSTHLDPQNRHKFIRCNMYGGGDVVFTTSGNTEFIECFIHDTTPIIGSHMDGIQNLRSGNQYVGCTVMTAHPSTGYSRTYALNNESIWAQIHDLRIEDCFIGSGLSGLVIYWNSGDPNNRGIVGPGTGHVVRRICFAKDTFDYGAWSIHDKTTSWVGASETVAEMGLAGHGSDWIWEDLWWDDNTGLSTTSTNNTILWNPAGKTAPDWASRTDYSAAY